MVVQREPFLSERENQRAVDLIEEAERSAPYCLCGQHMLAVAEGEQVWLECSGRIEQKTGLAGILARLTAVGHTRRLIMELPATN
jgi:hypothetical protein